MILTILEGHVSSGRWGDLEIAYRKGIKGIPVQLRQTFLIQDLSDKTLWRIVSIWRSAEAYQDAIDHPIHSSCEAMYQSVGVHPTKRVFTVKSQHMQV